MQPVLDLHCHLLPGIDDGPRDVAASLALARTAVVDGVEAIAATPHLRPDHPNVVPGELAQRCAQISKRLDAEGIDIRVVSGGEVDLLWGLEASDDDLRLCSYAQRGTDLLLETPYGPLPQTFEQMLFELTLRGFRLLLAHPERNPTFQSDPDRLADLVRRGVLVQVTASSLAASPRQSGSARLARHLLADHLVHVIASDAHGAETVLRASIREGGQVVAELIGSERARWLVTDAPRAIVAGQPLPPMPEADRSRRGLLGRLRG
jgi:protein-tyrosine phosphatase